MTRAQAVIPKTRVANFVIAATLAVATCYNGGAAFAQQAPPFAITSTPPTELNSTGGGPAQATLQQASEFAWEEFFALNWPAGPQSGQLNQRDTPSATCAFGDHSSNCSGPLVWETFRGKVEIFPGHGSPPGYTATAPSYGYDALPEYVYGQPPYNNYPLVGACPDSTPDSQTAWLNLDETDQITLDSMYAGVVSVEASASNSAPQLIRFLAKANRKEYVYIAKHQWWDGSAPTGLTAIYVKDNKRDPTDADKYVLLPDNSIEMKAGWRVLNPSEMSGGRFHTATVRYYEKLKGSTNPNATCY